MMYMYVPRSGYRLQNYDFVNLHHVHTLPQPMSIWKHKLYREIINRNTHYNIMHE